jgi:uncharacterized protein (DUF1501 family)
MDRRSLLKYAAGLSLMPLAGQLIAAPAGGVKFLLVFLRGGYDAASLLVPYSSDFYYASRPHIAVPRPADKADDKQSVLVLDANWGLHPALRDSIFPLCQSGQTAFIPFAGTDDVSRSHFETQDSIEMGQGAAGHAFRSGFLNRLVTVLQGQAHARPIAFTEQLPLTMQGTTPVPNFSLGAMGKSVLDPRQSEIIASMYKNTPLANSVQEGFEVRKAVMEQLSGEMEAASRNAVSTRGFEDQARQIARLMQDHYDIGFVDVGGWDTHVGQGAGSASLGAHFGELGRGLAAFAQQMGSGWRNTVVVVMSEFGRTLRENGNRGTDHGHGSVYWVLGGGLQSGSLIAGHQVEVKEATLFQNRDYPVLNEYRTVLAGLFSRMYGLSPASMGQIFPGVTASDLRLI